MKLHTHIIYHFQTSKLLYKLCYYSSGRDEIIPRRGNMETNTVVIIEVHLD